MNKEKHTYIFFSVIILIILVIVAFFIEYKEPIAVKDVDVSFIVGGNPGFDLNATTLTFGKIQNGMSSVREVIVSNDYDFPVEVKILASKNIAEFIQVKNNFYLDPKEIVNLQVTLSIPDGSEFGNYSGKLRIMEYKR